MQTNTNIKTYASFKAAAEDLNLTEDDQIEWFTLENAAKMQKIDPQFRDGCSCIAVNIGGQDYIAVDVQDVVASNKKSTDEVSFLPFRPIDNFLKSGPGFFEAVVAGIFLGLPAALVSFVITPFMKVKNQAIDPMARAFLRSKK